MTQEPKNKSLYRPRQRHAVVIGAGSFGTAIAVLLTRAGLRTTLLSRTEEQTEQLKATRENSTYLPGIELPSELRFELVGSPLGRAQYVFLAIPSQALGAIAGQLDGWGLQPSANVVSLTKGLLPPDGALPTDLLERHFGGDRIATIGGPAHAQEMVNAGAGLVAAADSERLVERLARIFLRAGVVCEQSVDPVGVELAGAAKNAATLATGATANQGFNAAGAAASQIFAEVWELATRRGASFDSFVGLAGIGDLVATALAPASRNRRAGELLAAGTPASAIPAEIGQAVEALESVPLLALVLEQAAVEAPVTAALAQLIAGEMPLKQWTALVRTTVPPRRWLRQGHLRRWWLRRKRRS